MRRIVCIDDRDRLLESLDTLRASVLKGRTLALAIATDEGEDGTGYLVACRDVAANATIIGAVALLLMRMGLLVTGVAHSKGSAFDDDE